MNTLCFCHKFLFCFALQSLCLTPNSVEGWGVYNISRSDKVLSFEYFCKYLTSLQLYSVPKVWVWPTLNNHEYLYKTALFDEAPEDNFKAEIISLEKLINPNFFNFITFWAKDHQEEGGPPVSERVNPNPGSWGHIWLSKLWTGITPQFFFSP